MWRFESFILLSIKIKKLSGSLVPVAPQFGWACCHLSVRSQHAPCAAGRPHENLHGLLAPRQADSQGRARSPSCRPKPPAKNTWLSSSVSNSCKSTQICSVGQSPCRTQVLTIPAMLQGLCFRPCWAKQDSEIMASFFISSSCRHFQNVIGISDLMGNTESTEDLFFPLLNIFILFFSVAFQMILLSFTNPCCVFELFFLVTVQVVCSETALLEGS